jgi:hypothetical protein
MIGTVLGEGLGERLRFKIPMRSRAVGGKHQTEQCDHDLNYRFFTDQCKGEVSNLHIVCDLHE